MCGRKFKDKKVLCNVLDPGIIRTFQHNSTAWKKNSSLEVFLTNMVWVRITLNIIVSKEYVLKSNQMARYVTM